MLGMWVRELSSSTPSFCMYFLRFRTLFHRFKHDHPLLYLKSVKFSDLVSILNFMYHGEVNIAQEDLSSFLAAAQDLKVKGLTQPPPPSSSATPTPGTAPPTTPPPAEHKCGGNAGK